MHRSLAIALLAVCICFSGKSITVCLAQNATLEPVAIQLRWFHQFQFAGYYAAIEKGFYADEGLHVTLREVEPGEDQIATVLEGKTQYGIGDPALLRLRCQGKPVVVLAQIFQHSPQVLISKKESDIFSPDDLAGRKVMLATDYIGSVPIRAMILDVFGDMRHITVVPHDYSYTKLIDGEVDAMAAYLSNAPLQLKKQGILVNIMDPRSYGIDFYGDNLFTTEKEIEEHPERVEKMIRATLKGWAYALEHKDEIIELIRNRYNPEIDIDQLRYEAKIIDQMMVPDLIPIGEINPRRYARIAETYQRLGLTKISSVPDGFLYEGSSYKKANQTSNEKTLSSNQAIELTPDERAWVESNHTVRVFSTDHAPLMSFMNGKPVGVSVELLNEVSKSTGIKFDIGDPHMGFPEAIKGLMKKEGPDVIAGLNPSPEREKSILFTKPFLTSPKFIFIRDDAPFVYSTKNLSGKTVAVVGGYVTHELLARDYPDIKLLICTSNEEALRAVSSGKAFAFVGSLLATSSMINKFGLTNLKAAVPSALPDATVGMGVRSDWPELRSIMDKVFDAMPASEKTAIMNKWSSVKVDYGISPNVVVKWVLIVLSGSICVAVMFLLWNRNLAKKVRERTVELETSNQALTAEVAKRTNAEKLLQESSDYLESLLDSMPDAVFSIKMPERVIEWANDTYDVFGYAPSECVGGTTEFLYPDKRDYLDMGAKVEKAIAEGKEILAVEGTMRRKDGELFSADINLSFFRIGDEVARITAIARNINDRKQVEQQILQYQKQLKALASQVTLTAEKERRAIAADLHDHVGHSLALARMQLNSIRQAKSELEKNILVNDVSTILLTALQDTKNLISELSTPSMNEMGLGAAISEWLEEQIEIRHRLETEFTDHFSESHRKSLDENAAALMFRNVRELLVNVVKHARATKVYVRLWEDDGMLKVVVEDDGIGFDLGTPKTSLVTNGGFGLFSVQERMNDLGGSLDIESTPSKGCRVTMTAPMARIRKAMTEASTSDTELQQK